MPKRIRFNQWDREDVVTKEEWAIALRKRIAEKLGVSVAKASDVRRLLTRYEQLKERGLIE